MVTAIEIAIVLLVIWAVWRFIARLRGRPEVENEDPHSYVGAPLKRGPQDRAGAVALEEPEDEEEQ